MPKRAQEIDWPKYNELIAQEPKPSLRQVSREMGVPIATLHRQLRAREAANGGPTAHPSPPSVPARRYTQVRHGTPAKSTGADRSVPEQPTPVHPSTPKQSTGAHLGVPIAELQRLITLLPDIEALAARERDRQRLLSTPIGTPRHTVKKTYVIDALFVDLVERFAQTEGLELKDVMNLALAEFFEKRQMLPPE